MAAHDAAAARALPGPDFHHVLQWIHQIAKPAIYVEIGVHSGGSLTAVLPGTFAIGIDPEPREEFIPPGIQIYRLTSSEFFRKHDLSSILGGRAVDLALIDGFHLFEQALEDFCNLERYMAPEGIMAVHDTIPLNRETSSRQRVTEFYTGDVWKIVPFLSRYRPELTMTTVLTAPTGLTLIRGFDPAYRHRQLHRHIAGYRDLDFDDFVRYRAQFLQTIPNLRSAVEVFCQKTAVQSTRLSGVVMPSR